MDADMGMLSGHNSYHINSLSMAEWGQHANQAKYKPSNIQEKAWDYTLRTSLKTLGLTVP